MLTSSNCSAVFIVFNFCGTNVHTLTIESLNPTANILESSVISAQQTLHNKFKNLTQKKKKSATTSKININNLYCEKRNEIYVEKKAFTVTNSQILLTAPIL